MPIPTFCPNDCCSNHVDPAPNWFVRFGSYPTIAHGTVPRYRCRDCGTTVSNQTESIHYYAKRRLPLKAVYSCLTTSTSLRDVARRYRVSSAAIRNGVLRLGRQSMAAQMHLLAEMHPRSWVVFDGLRSFVTSQDFPCDLTTVVDRQGETILTMSHAIFRRGGRTTSKQQKRCMAKYAVWKPARGTLHRDISLVVNELWRYLRPEPSRVGIIDTDEHPGYAWVLRHDPISRHLRQAGILIHRRTPSTLPRTCDNPLFPVNYVDRLLRHREKEHMRETIAFGRHAVVQMHRAWIFAWDHNSRREYRVKQPELGTHAEQGTVDRRVINRVNREFYERRIRLRGVVVPRSIQRVWRSRLPTPPVRWRVRQKGTTVVTPAYATRDLAAGDWVPISTRF